MPLAHFSLIMTDLFKRCLHKSVLMALLVIMVAGMAGCHSKKKVVENNRTNTTHRVSDEWRTLDIKLGRGDNKRLYKEVKSWLGTPYKYAGSSKSGTDCSGFVMEVYKEVYHQKLERNSQKIFEKNCYEINKGDLKEGDLIFFNTGNKKRRINHVGIYLKENMFVHASSSRGVVVSDVRETYYVKHFVVAGRVRKD